MLDATNVKNPAKENADADAALVEIIKEAEQRDIDLIDHVAKRLRLPSDPKVRRLVWAGVKQIRDTHAHAFRTAVKSVSISSYNKDYLTSLAAGSKSRDLARREALKKAGQEMAPIAATADKVVHEARLALTILDEWRVGGKRLGDATKLDLISTRDKDRDAASGFMMNVAFYNALIEKLPTDDSTVRSSVSVEDVNLIREKCYG